MATQYLGRVAAIMLLAFSAQPTLAADPPWAARLRADLVRLQDGKFVYEDLALCAISSTGQANKNVQIRSRAEAPARDVISRDQFVALVSQYETILTLGLTAAAQGRLSCKVLDEPIGVPDLEISIVMTKNGLQYETVVPATGKVERRVLTWAELFPE